MIIKGRKPVPEKCRHAQDWAAALWAIFTSPKLFILSDILPVVADKVEVCVSQASEANTVKALWNNKQLTNFFIYSIFEIYILKHIKCLSQSHCWTLAHIHVWDDLRLIYHSERFHCDADGWGAASLCTNAKSRSLQASDNESINCGCLQIESIKTKGMGVQNRDASSFDEWLSLKVQ